ncbi:TetR/AcrR family transcriptional regulator [Tateyamaria sp.]|nr:TetR/AcrR family transcriptional regulator [Tateyamaria sp.]
MSKQSLSPATWIDAGLEQLAALGPAALRAEPLSRHLNTSKGSFYWHFKDVPAFQVALLDTWQARVLNKMRADVNLEGSPTDKLIRFGQMVQFDIAGPALRAWAQTNQAVASTLADVDKARMERLSQLLAEVGITNGDFAKAAYGTLVGLQQIQMDDGDALVAYATLVDLAMALE